MPGSAAPGLPILLRVKAAVRGAGGAALLLLLGWGGAFALAANDLTVTAAPSPITVSSAWSTVVTAQAPVVNAGVQNQEIVQTFDPAQLRLTGPGDITFPNGWTATYSSKISSP